MTETSKTALLCTFAFLATGVISWAVVSKRSPHGEVDAPPSIIAPSPSTPNEEHVPDLLTLSENELAVTLGHLTSAQIRRAIRPITAGNMADIHHQSVLKAALEALAAKDPKHFLHWIDTADLSLALATPAIELAASILAQGDPEESFATIKAMSSKRMGYIATLAYGTALAHHAPETAVEQMIEAGALLDVGRTAGAVWAAKDPKAAANYFTSIHGKQMVAMQTGIRAVMAEWASQDPEGALEWTKTGTDLLARRLASNYLLNALADDPKTADTALQYISELPAGSQRTMLMSSLGWNFRQHDTFDETLLTKAIEIGNPFENAKILADLTGKVDPDLANQVIKSLNGRSKRQAAIKRAATSITDRATGQQLIDSLDSPSDRIAARSAVFSQLTRKDPVEAVQLAFETDYPREQARLLSSLAERLVPTKRKTLPLTDVLWMRELEPNQRDAVEAAVHDWVSENELELPAALAEVFE